MSSNEVIASFDTEEAVLGSILVGGKQICERLTTDVGLRPEHFFRHDHGQIFAAMIALLDAGESIDAITVAERSKTDLGHLHHVAGSVPAVGHFSTYGRRIIELSNYRRIKTAGEMLVKGAQQEDQDTISQAELLLTRPMGTVQSSFDPEELGEQLYEFLSAGDPETFPWPFQRLNDLTSKGMRRGQVTLIGGWSSHGKSVFLDQCLESAAEKGSRVHLFINEMTELERTIRTVSRMTGLAMGKISGNDLIPVERSKIIDVIGKIPFGITNCAGWPVEDVARSIRRNPYDVVGIDILHLFEYKDEADLRRISRVLNAVSKQANCHLLVTVHLNENRVKENVRPNPTLGDIRGSGSLKNDADNVMFVHRQQDEMTGYPEAEGAIYFAKQRMGALGGVKTIFHGTNMRFSENYG